MKSNNHLCSPFIAVLHSPSLCYLLQPLSASDNRISDHLLGNSDDHHHFHFRSPFICNSHLPSSTPTFFTIVILSDNLHCSITFFVADMISVNH
ncbi:hypothetical protein Hanom_Chr09g00800381 [Helianthus anomalus]